MAILTFLAIALILVAGWTAWRGRAPVAYAGVLLIGYAAMVMLMGTPKPADFSALDDEAEVLWAELAEGEAIYILLPGPRLYRLPWDRGQAEQLQEAQQEAEDDGGEVRARRLNSDAERMFYAKPQPAPPPKE